MSKNRPKNWISFMDDPKVFTFTPNFNLISSNEITLGANHKFFTLTLNDLKAIAENQGNYVG